MIWIRWLVCEKSCQQRHQLGQALGWEQIEMCEECLRGQRHFLRRTYTRKLFRKDWGKKFNCIPGVFLGTLERGGLKVCVGGVDRMQFV